MRRLEDPIPLDQLMEDGAELRDGHGKTAPIIRSSMAIVSIIASTILIWMLRRSHVGLSTTYHRLLLGMCIADIIFSLSLAHFNFLAPSDDGYYVWNARGNVATCNFQGFLAYSGAMCGLLYNCSLNLYYLALVKYQKPDDYIRARIEPFLHGVPIITSIVGTIILLVRKNINHDGEGICFEPIYEPPHCIGYEDGQIREGFDIPCGRGREGSLVLMYLGFYIAILGAPIIAGISLGMIYRTVKEQERKMSRYRATTFNNQNQHSNDDVDGNARSSLAFRLSRMATFRSPTGQTSSELNEDRVKSRAVMRRAIAYSIAYLLTWSWIIIRVSFNVAGIDWPVALWYLTCIFNPLQGLYNLLIFLHPKALSAKRSRRNDLTWCQAFAKAFWSRGIDASTRGSRDRNNNNGMQQNNIQPDSSAVEAVESSEVEEQSCPENEDETPQIRRRSSEIV